MSKQCPVIFALLACQILIGCSDEQQQTPATMSEDNVFKGQVDSLEKAKGVESTIKDGFDKQRQRIDTQ